MLIDALGHPIRVGDTVRTNGYGTASYAITTKVTKVTEKAVYVKVRTYRRQYNSTQQRFEYNWVEEPIRRRPDQFLVVTQQLEYNQKKYPENLL